MKKISKMVYEAPFVEIVPMENNLMDKALSLVDHGDGKKEGITTVHTDDGKLNLSKDWGLDWGDVNDGLDWE